MDIPKTFKVGTMHYTVHLKPSMTKNTWGKTWVDLGVMHIRTRYDNAPRPVTGPKGINTTFWHEVTHCILYDMGHPLYSDEAFVTAFSKKLNQVIETAEF